MRHQQHAHRGPRPRRGDPAAAHRDRQLRPAVARVVGHLRPGDGEQQPARLHHDRPAACPRRRAELLQRLPAGHLPGHGDRHGRRPGEGRVDPLPLQRQALPRDAAAAARPDPAAEPSAPPAVRGRCADRRDGAVVRAGLPHADGGALGARTGPASRTRRCKLYGIGTRRPTTSAGSACWPAASPSPACASSRSPQATSGTSTRTW